MTASALCRWHRAWISGAGIACLGLSGILCGGCAPLGSEVTSSASSAKRQQVSESNSPSANQKVARKYPPQSKKKPVQKYAKNSTRKPTQKPAVQVAENKVGRVRISDGKSPETEVASTAPATKPSPQQRPTVAKSKKTPAPREPDRELVAHWVETLEPSADGTKASTTKKSVKPATATRLATKRPAAPAKEASVVAAMANREVDQASNDKSPKDAVTTAGDSRASKPKKKPASAEAPRDVAPKQAVAAAPAADHPPRGSSHERQRANVLMERAHIMCDDGYPEEALRLASVAAELEYSRQAVYRKGEERPSDFIAWLQSATGGRSASRPVTGTVAPQTGDTTSRSQEAGMATASGAAPTKRPLGKIVRADGRSFLQSRETSNRNVAAVSTNSRLELPVSGNSSSGYAEHEAFANSRTGDATEPPAGQISEMSAAEQTSNDVQYAALSPNDVPPPPADSRQFDIKPGAAGSPRLIASVSPGEPGTSAAVDSDAFAESDAAGTAPSHTTQLTLIGIIGLLTGVAGMAGLKWWHIQERRHFAAKPGAEKTR
jgi:hypothetical protein